LARFGVYLFQKVRFEIAVSDDSLDPIVEAIINGGAATWDLAQG